MWNKALVPKGSRGKLFVISAPAGTGKTTLVRRLVKTFPAVVQALSVTTRPMRKGEAEGVDYHFVTKEEFARRAAREEFLEKIEFFGYWYATPQREIEDQRARGRHVIVVIDTRGAMALKGLLDPVLIFVKPPSFEALAERLKKRGSEEEQALQRETPHGRKKRWAMSLSFITALSTIGSKMLLTCLRASWLLSATRFNAEET